MKKHDKRVERQKEKEKNEWETDQRMAMWREIKTKKERNEMK